MLIQSKRVWIADQFIPAQIEIDDNKITDIYNYNEKAGAFDYGDKRILPGFIDIHCHGAYGFDTNDANAQGLRKWTKGIVSEGVTSILPTCGTPGTRAWTTTSGAACAVQSERRRGGGIRLFAFLRTMY